MNRMMLVDLRWIQKVIRPQMIIQFHIPKKKKWPERKQQNSTKNLTVPIKAQI